MKTTERLNFILEFNQLFKKTLSAMEENMAVMDELETQLQTLARDRSQTNTESGQPSAQVYSLITKSRQRRRQGQLARNLRFLQQELLSRSSFE